MIIRERVLERSRREIKERERERKKLWKEDRVRGGGSPACFVGILSIKRVVALKYGGNKRYATRSIQKSKKCNANACNKLKKGKSYYGTFITKIIKPVLFQTKF